MGCCGDDPETKEQGIVKNRKCRDILCLLIFLAFWAGMFVICAFAVREGDSNRLVYGVDSYGFTCGGKATFQNVTLDLSDRKNLYYLNALDLLSASGISYAKRVCASSCPGAANVCNITQMPCNSSIQYRCPYYRFAGNELYGKLTGVSDIDTQWYQELLTMQPTTDPNATQIVDKLTGLNVQWINDWLAQYGINNNGTVGGRYYQLQSQIPGYGPCYPVWVETSEVFHRCFPKIPTEWASSVVQAGAAVGGDAVDAFKKEFSSLSERWTRYVGDISKGILIIIVAGLVAGVVLSLIWMLILRYFAGVMAWLTIILVNVALIGFTLYCFVMAGLLGSDEFRGQVASALPNVDPTEVERNQWKWIGIAAAVVAGIIFLITLLMISRIRVAIACIKVASQAVGSMPSILLFPLLPFVFEVGLLIYWIAITGLLYSAGDLTANCRSPDSSPFTFSNFSSVGSSPSTTSNSSCYAGLPKDEQASLCGSDHNCYLTYDWNDRLKYAFIYHFFGLLWTNQFIVGFGCVTIAGAIASYYWARGDSAQMPTFPVLVALKNTTIYHCGSVAFGSFIIAVIQFIRFLLDYLDRKTRELQSANKCAEWAMCCVKCCMWCLEKIVAFINRNAYILVAVKGTNYCVSAGRAVALIVTNALRLAAVNFIGDILIFLGKVAIAAGGGVIALALSEIDYYNNATKYPDTYLYSPILPVAVSIITAFVVAEIFFSVYEMAIDTVLLSFCEDCESNNGEPRFAPPLLMEAVGAKPQPPSQPNSHGSVVKPISG
uniref:Choline transporter-like protein n=1 Tax=Chlamydomonas leiostraca TaxID=1034604 RepID=A0A7S0RW54_9CHLO|mmetsp:Transcript_32424/g.82364  ORF Transcript_32424/g.82364 Transcript_32424/m.82364 type:complete len:775 (+) Transcript_32424:222-2546(+)|eukprot:CAMPEP_0202885164 /NCGR_PEP_ID=MMETSP1391-20130828/41521_1 /ASSEMBLY_ACC=CAM_ASM_000867 /TAXON_ID=1034604 /ORGANISM="Chlamydomonas leiostraca, Strain SAG 11-49" /LENGTH=774 /DNA_ID=CAMNT_0049568407 /DNA_START=161 /DNA_END=2485 /DNA_ORIENTATION=-